MGKLDNQATTTLIVNGEQAKTSLKEVTSAVRGLTAEINNMHKADDPSLYEEKIQQLQQLRTAQAEMRAEIAATTEESKGFFSEFTSGLTQIRTLAATVGLFSLIQGMKDLMTLESKASGIEQAFSKLGDTAGLLEKLRTASRGLMSDLDLQQLAVKANNANIPLDKMGTFLAFAEQRARDTGESVTDLTTRLIEGLGKNSPRALSGLGISVKEVREDFKQTGDMVQSVSNIISREMANDGTDVDTFGDKVESLASRWQNLKTKAGEWLQSILMPQLADPNAVERQTNDAMKNFQGYQAFNDKMLSDAINKQQQTVQLYKKSYDNAQATFKELDSHTGFQRIADSFKPSSDDIKNEAKLTAEDYQAQRNVLDALMKEKEKRDQAKQQQGDQGKINDKKDFTFDREMDSFNEQSQQLTDRYNQFNQTRLTDTMSVNDKQLRDTVNKYDQQISALKEFINKTKKLQDEIKKNPDLTPAERKKGVAVTQSAITGHEGEINELNSAKDKEVADLTVKQAKATNDAIQKFQNEQTTNLDTNLDKQKVKINEFYDDLRNKLANDDVDGALTVETARNVSLAKAEASAKLGQEQKYQEDKKKLEDEYDGITDQKDKSELAKLQSKYDAELNMFRDQLKQKQITQAQYDKLASQADKNFEASKTKLQSDNLKNWEVAAIEAAQEIANTGFDIHKQNIQSQESAQVSALEKQRNNELSNRNLTQTQIAAINDKYDAKEAAIKLKAWQAQQKANEEQVLVNGAMAIAKLYAEHPTGFFDPVFDESLAAILVNTATQEALIASQQAPQFGKGGLIKGKSHAQGGVPLIDGNTGMPVAEVEGDEVVAVFSRETVANNGMLINELLYNGQHRNGAPVSVNTTQATTALRQYATGGVITATAGASQYHSTHAPMPHFSNADVVQAINALGDKINNKKVILNRTAFDEEDARYAEIVRRARLGG